jgi:hypothetical protein
MGILREANGDNTANFKLSDSWKLVGPEFAAAERIGFLAMNHRSIIAPVCSK